MGNDTSQRPEPYPLQLDRVKREAKRLSHWTGAPLSQCQEVTARALGATSWQALLKSKSFIPDERLLLPGRGGELTLESRYLDMGLLLAKNFSLALPLADVMAALWQPSALRAVFQRPRIHRPANSGALPHWTLQYDLGASPALPEGATFALAVRSDLNSNLGLVAVRAGRRALHMNYEDCLFVGGNVQVDPALAMELRAEMTITARLKRLKRALAKPNAITWTEAEFNSLCDTATPAQIVVPWLQQAYDRDDLVKKFAKEFPWRREDYPGLKKSSTAVFWSGKFGPLTLQASVAGGTLGFVAYDGPAGASSHSWVQAGVGGLRHLTEDSGGSRLTPGYYLVKYDTQARGRRPLPGVTEEVADEICERTGLSSGYVDQLLRGQSGQRLSFFASEVGFAWAKWVAARRSRVEISEDSISYLGDPLGGAFARMYFELVRANTLG